MRSLRGGADREDSADCYVGPIRAESAELVLCGGRGGAVKGVEEVMQKGI